MGLWIDRPYHSDVDRLLKLIERTDAGRNLISDVNMLSGSDINVNIKISPADALWDNADDLHPLQQFPNKAEKAYYASQHSHCSLELGDTPRFSSFDKDNNESTSTTLFSGAHKSLPDNTGLVHSLSGDQGAQDQAILDLVKAGNLDAAEAITLYHELVHQQQILQSIRSSSPLMSPDQAEAEAYKNTVTNYLSAPLSGRR